MRDFLTTSQVAKAAGVHPNTVRLYESWHLLPPVPRTASGYRRFSESHVRQMRLLRAALRWPYPGGRQAVVRLAMAAAAGDYVGALSEAHAFLKRLDAEIATAEAALATVERWASSRQTAPEPGATMSIREVAHLLGTTADALRNWERNGLISVPRDPGSGYRVYSNTEIERLRVILTLRRSGYGMMAILRMVHALDQGRHGDLRAAMDTPGEDEEVEHVTNRWLSTLIERRVFALEAIHIVEEMIATR